jgi:cytochrome c biogenesis protein CcdA
MFSLLKIGSSKRALKAGLIYSFIVFLVYFLSGFGIFKAIQAFTSITHFIYLAAGILVLSLGLWQFKDVFIPNFGPSLRISPKVGPLIEKILSKGTLPGIILLGVLVSLFELPCTGGIYLGILTLMSINKTFAISYLLIYNLIFILPLIFLSFIIYKGTKPGKLQEWVIRNKYLMKIASGIVLIALGIYILAF